MRYLVTFFRRDSVTYYFNHLKGCKNVALTRDDAGKFLKSQLSLTFYNWIIHLLVPDESFFSTLASVDVLENGTVVQDLTKNTTHGLVRGRP